MTLNEQAGEVQSDRVLFSTGVHDAVQYHTFSKFLLRATVPVGVASYLFLLFNQAPQLLSVAVGVLIAGMVMFFAATSRAQSINALMRNPMVWNMAAQCGATIEHTALTIQNAVDKKSRSVAVSETHCLSYTRGTGQSSSSVTITNVGQPA